MKAGVAFALLAMTSTRAQSPRPARLEFEVASIRPSPTVNSPRGIRIDGAQVHFAGFLLREYIARAYQVRVSQVIGPEWLPRPCSISMPSSRTGHVPRKSPRCCKHS